MKNGKPIKIVVYMSIDDADRLIKNLQVPKNRPKKETPFKIDK